MNNDHIQNNYDNSNNNNSNNNNNNDNNNNNNKNEEEADKGIRKTKGDVKKNAELLINCNNIYTIEKKTYLEKLLS